MKKIMFVIAIILSIHSITFAQWIANYHGSNTGDNPVSDSRGVAITIDRDGYCLVAGYTYSAETGNDIITIKYNQNGDTVWSRLYNGSGNSDDKAYAIVVDNLDNIYVTGTANVLNDSNDVILIKYSSSGDLQWASTFSGAVGTGVDKALAIAIDASNNIYITGYCTNSDGILNMVTLKYNDSGDQLWYVKEPGPDNIESKGLGIAVDHAGNINVTGYIRTASGQNDIALVQYDPNGNRDWITVYGNPEDDKAYAIVVDGSDNICITGYISTANSNTDCIVQKYSSAGDLLWNKTYNGEGNGEDKAYAIVVDSDGSIYITGFATGAASGSDYVTIKYDSTGAEDWSELYNGPANGEDRATSIGILQTNGNASSIVVTGESWGSDGNHDYATVKYSSTQGGLQQVSRFSMTTTSDDVAQALTTSSDHQVFVTGYSEIIINAPWHGYSVISTIMIPFKEPAKTVNGPDKFNLYQNYPNPFNPVTTIKFDLTRSAFVKLEVYDILGRVVQTLVNENMNAGSYAVNFNASNISYGIYFYRITSGHFTAVKKMSLVK
jgi:uncharacterized delta-60 repeat protein